MFSLLSSCPTTKGVKQTTKKRYFRNNSLNSLLRVEMLHRYTEEAKYLCITLFVFFSSESMPEVQFTGISRYPEHPSIVVLLKHALACPHASPNP